MSNEKVYVVKKYIIEEFEVIANSKEEARFLVEDPHTVTVKKETIKLKK